MLWDPHQNPLFPTSWYIQPLAAKCCLITMCSSPLLWRIPLSKGELSSWYILHNPNILANSWLTLAKVYSHWLKIGRTLGWNLCSRLSARVPMEANLQLVPHSFFVLLAPALSCFTYSPSKPVISPSIIPLHMNSYLKCCFLGISSKMLAFFLWTNRPS